MLTLDNLKPLRLASTLKRDHLAAVTGIPADRLRELELRMCEPWFDEALQLHRALGTAGIGQLMCSDYPNTSHDLSPLPTDEDAWRHGTRAPLSLAARIAVAFGLPDPADLAVPPVMRQLWDILACTERHPEAPGWCAWCGADILGGESHRPTCLPNNLLTPHSLRLLDTPTTLVRPKARVQRQQGIPAYGLKALREQHELLQRDVAEAIGIHPNYYARVERASIPLSAENADALAAFYKVDRAVLYARPGT